MKNNSPISVSMIEQWTTDKYYLLTTISEFIDNSLSSAQNSKQKQINVKIMIDESNSRILFIDNGKGIKQADLNNVWRFYDDVNNTGLNRNHVGFKRGGFFLGKRIELFSSNDTEKHGSYLDFNEMKIMDKNKEDINDIFSYKKINDTEIIDLALNKIGSETGSVFIVSDFSWRDEKRFDFAVSPFKEKLPVKGLMNKSDNIYVQLYLKYCDFIENKNDVQLFLSVIFNSEIKEVSRKAIGIPEVTFENINFWEKVIGENYENDEAYISYKEMLNEFEEQELVRKNNETKYGISMTKIKNDLLNGKTYWNFRFPFNKIMGNEYQILNASFYLLNNTEIENFTKQDFFKGISIIQDGRSINMGSIDNKSVFFKPLVKFLKIKGSGDLSTEDKFWMANIYMDKNNDETIRNSFKPTDDKSSIANKVLVENLMSKFIKFLKDKLFLNEMLAPLVSKQKNQKIELKNTLKNISNKSVIDIKSKNKVIREYVKNENKLTNKITTDINNDILFDLDNNTNGKVDINSFGEFITISLEYSEIHSKNIFSLFINPYKFTNSTKLNDKDFYLKMAIHFLSVLYKEYDKNIQNGNTLEESWDIVNELVRKINLKDVD